MLNILIIAALVVTGVLLHRQEADSGNGKAFGYAHIALGLALLLKILMHAAGKLAGGSATGPVAVFGAIALCALVVEIVLGAIMYTKPELRQGALGTAHRVIPVVLIVVIAIHVGCAVLG